LLNLRWIAEKGIATLEKRNKAKAKMLYNAIDRSAFFSGIAAPTSRSLMNVCFHAKRPELEKPFLDFAASRNITGIQGHRSIGGFRAALYNAVEPDAVAHLVAVMEEFETSYGKQNDFLSK
jgi:phosphoserine aminotransferase